MIINNKRALSYIVKIDDIKGTKLFVTLTKETINN